MEIELDLYFSTNSMFSCSTVETSRTEVTATFSTCSVADYYCQIDSLTREKCESSLVKLWNTAYDAQLSLPMANYRHIPFCEEHQGPDTRETHVVGAG